MNTRRYVSLIRQWRESGADIQAHNASQKLRGYLLDFGPDLHRAEVLSFVEISFNYKVPQAILSKDDSLILSIKPELKNYGKIGFHCLQVWVLVLRPQDQQLLRLVNQEDTPQQTYVDKGEIERQKQEIEILRQETEALIFQREQDNALQTWQLERQKQEVERLRKENESLQQRSHYVQTQNDNWNGVLRSPEKKGVGVNPLEPLRTTTESGADKARKRLKELKKRREQLAGVNESTNAKQLPQTTDNTSDLYLRRMIIVFFVIVFGGVGLFMFLTLYREVVFSPEEDHHESTYEVKKEVREVIEDTGEEATPQSSKRPPVKAKSSPKTKTNPPTTATVQKELRVSLSVASNSDAIAKCKDGQTRNFAGQTQFSFLKPTKCLIEIDGVKGFARIKKSGDIHCQISGSGVLCK